MKEIAQCLILILVFIRFIKGFIEAVEHENEKNSNFNVIFETIWLCISLFVLHKAGLFSEIL